MAFGLIAIIGCLGGSLVWALYEIEQSRQRSYTRAAIVRDAFKNVNQIESVRERVDGSENRRTRQNNARRNSS